MPRGGRREGAGRKPKFDYLDRMALGAACESRFQEAWEKAIERAWEERRGVSELNQIRAEMNAVPVPERRAFIRSIAGEELRSDVEQAVRSMRKTPDFVEQTNRLFTVSAPRPKGLRPKIIAAVAKLYSENWGVPVSARMVERCWKEHRATLRALEEDDTL